MITLNNMIDSYGNLNKDYLYIFNIYKFLLTVTPLCVHASYLENGNILYYIQIWTWHTEHQVPHIAWTIFLFSSSVTLEAHFSGYRAMRAEGPSELTCNFKCLPCARTAGRLTTIPISFSHEIYEKSGYQRATDRPTDIATALYSLAAYWELFMRDQIDWFGDNIRVARIVLDAPRLDAEPLTSRASASVTLDYVCSYTSHTL